MHSVRPKRKEQFINYYSVLVSAALKRDAKDEILLAVYATCSARVPVLLPIRTSTRCAQLYSLALKGRVLPPLEKDLLHY